MKKTSFALAALLFAGLCVAAAYGTTRLVRDVLFKLELNEWQGMVSPQARLVDLRPSPRSS